MNKYFKPSNQPVFDKYGRILVNEAKAPRKTISDEDRRKQYPLTADDVFSKEPTAPLNLFRAVYRLLNSLFCSHDWRAKGFGTNAYHTEKRCCKCKKIAFAIEIPSCKNPGKQATIYDGDYISLLATIQRAHNDLQITQAKEAIAFFRKRHSKTKDIGELNFDVDMLFKKCKERSLDLKNKYMP